MKKWMIIVIAVVAVVAVVGTVLGVTLAAWRSRPITDQDIPVPTEDFNPSAKHIRYCGVDMDGHMRDNANEIASCAAVGYSGLVSTLQFPSTAIVGNQEYAVTHILSQQNDTTADGFQGNHVIRYLIIPSSVTYIAAGAFANCIYLEEVTFEAGNTAVHIGDGAFAGCINLRSFNNPRGVTADSGDYLFATP